MRQVDTLKMSYEIREQSLVTNNYVLPLYDRNQTF